MFNKIAQLILTPGKNAATWADIYVAQPDSEREQLAGKLFVIIETESRTVDDLKVINFIIENLEHNYYQNEKLILRERAKTIKIEYVFEAALAKTNKGLLEFVREEKIRFNPRGVNALIGVIYENEIHFANVGKNKAFLIFKDKTQPAAAAAPNKRSAAPAAAEVKYKAVNIIQETRSGDEPEIVAKEAKFFSSVISGNLPVGGYCVFTNEALSEYLSSKQLIDIVTALPPMSAVEQIKNILSKINAYVSFLAIIVKNTTGIVDEEMRMSVAPAYASTSQSILNMNATEEKTEKLLSPGGYINLRQWLKKITGILPGRRPASSAGALSNTALKDKIFYREKPSYFSPAKILSFLKNVILKIFGLFIFLLKTLTDKDAMLRIINGIGLKIRSRFDGTMLWFKNLSLRNKTILLVVAVCLVLAAQNIIIKNIQNKTDQKTNEVNNTLKTIDQKQNQIDANLLYGNEDMVRRLLAETKDLLDKLPKETGSGNEYQAYYNKYTEQSGKVRHVENLGNLVLVTDFSKLDPAAKPVNMDLISSGGHDKIYVADQERKSFYSIDPSTSTASTIGINGPIKTLAFPSFDSAGNVYYLNVDNVVVYNTKAGKITTMPISIVGGQDNTGGAKIFNNKLYLVDKQDSQIYSYVKTAAAFSAGEKWLSEVTQLASASALDIDGNVYVMKTDGQAFKFLKGARDKFDLDPVDPAVNSPAKFVIGENAKFFYVLEPAQKRLIVFNADGKFVLQYRSDKFMDLKDFAINEKTKMLYFLNGTTILKTAATHLK